MTLRCRARAAVLLRLACLVFAASQTAVAAPQDQGRPAGFVDAAQAVPGLVVDARYAGADNFIGRPIAGYEAPRCLLSVQAATALAAVQRELAHLGLGLKVFDCYRPKRAVDDFVRWSRDPADQARKLDFYPHVNKRKLFKLGYIASRSGHSRGSTVDLTMVTLDEGRELDMGGHFDLFDERSGAASARVKPQQRSHRVLLQERMRDQGFLAYRNEWWHFTLNKEPFPNTYFDFPVKAGE